MLWRHRICIQTNYIMFPKILTDCHRIINLFSYKLKKSLMFDHTVILFAITLSSVMLVLHGDYANSDRLDCGIACWNSFEFYFSNIYLGTAVAQWLRCCTTNRKVAGWILDRVSGFFIDRKYFQSHYDPGVDSTSN